MQQGSAPSFAEARSFAAGASKVNNYDDARKIVAELLSWIDQLEAEFEAANAYMDRSCKACPVEQSIAEHGGMGVMAYRIHTALAGDASSTDGEVRARLRASLARLIADMRKAHTQRSIMAEALVRVYRVEMMAFNGGIPDEELKAVETEMTQLTKELEESIAAGLLS